MLHQFDVRYPNGTVEKKSVDLVSDTPQLMGTLVSKYSNEVDSELALFERFHSRLPKEERFFRVDFFKEDPEKHNIPQVKVDTDEDFNLLQINDTIEDVDGEDICVYVLMCQIA